MGRGENRSGRRGGGATDGDGKESVQYNELDCSAVETFTLRMNRSERVEEEKTEQHLEGGGTRGWGGGRDGSMMVTWRDVKRIRDSSRCPTQRPERRRGGASV